MKGKDAESYVEKYLKDEVIKLGGFSRKYISPGTVGVPDRIVFYKGVYFVELKRPSGTLSPMQVRELQRMVQQGAMAGVLASKADVDMFINQLKELGESHAEAAGLEKGISED